MKNDLSVMNHADVVAQTFKVRGDVRGDQHAAARILREIASEHVEHFISCDNVKAGGRFIENEEPGLVGAGDEHPQAGLHAGGIFPDAFVHGKPAFFAGGKKCLLVKCPVHAAEDRGDVFKRQIAGKSGVGESDADIFPVLRGKTDRIPAENRD